MKKKWSEEKIIAVFRDYYEEYGEQPTQRAVRDKIGGLPSVDTVKRHFGSWVNALVAADFDSVNQGWNAKDEETEKLLERVRDGETLSEVAAEIGITGQALGRRIQRHIKTFDLPPLVLSTGRRSTNAGR